MNCVLFLIDFQNDFLQSPHLEPPRGELIEKIASLIDVCRTTNVPIIHIHTVVSRSADNRMPHWKSENRWMCIENTPGCQPPHPAKALNGEMVLQKTFFSGFGNPKLEALLADQKPDLVFVAGVHMHACVKTTALDLYQRGFRTAIVEDCVGSDQPVHSAIVRDYLSAKGLQFVQSENVMSYFIAPPGTNRMPGESSSRVTEAPAETEMGPDKEIRKATADCSRSIEESRAMDIAYRAAILRRTAKLLRDRAPDLAHRMALEIGKPVRYGSAEIARAADLLENVADYESQPLEIECEPGTYLRYVPRGVIALITPWNNPVAIPIGKIAPALLYGNAVVWKPSPAASLISREVGSMFVQAGCPQGLLNLVFGDAQTASTLMKNETIDAVTFSGSLHAGYSAHAICALRMIPFQGEFGGNNASIVWPDYDLKRAAALIAEGAFGFSGQRCTANRRAIVHRDCSNEFLRTIQEEVARMAAGDPFLPETQIGPLVSEKARNRVEAVLSRSSAVLLQGNPAFSGLDSQRAYHPPVIAISESQQEEIVQQETFGPVLVIQKAASWEEALRLCNGVKQGLVASLFSESLEIQHRFLREAAAGILKINRATSDAGVNVPFGGWKLSGVGPPEHGPGNREFYTRTQSLYR
jgi:acyl-CoA reductase-like NAD-dependent aldehyde dehydrogenase/nicotinamidase-related amidase